MPIAVVCPSCDARFQAKDSAVGKQGKCPKCGATIAVGDSSGTTNLPAVKPATAVPIIKPQVTLDLPKQIDPVQDWPIIPRPVLDPSAPVFNDDPSEWDRLTGYSLPIERKPTTPAVHHEAQELSPVRSPQPIKQCVFCGEDILAVAVKCKHCGEIVDTAMRMADEARKTADRAMTASHGGHVPKQIVQNVNVKSQRESQPVAVGCVTLLLIGLVFLILTALSKH